MPSEAALVQKDIDVAEISEAVTLHNVHEATNRTEEEWIWEYTGYLPESYTYIIAKDQGKIIATQGMIPVFLNVSGKVVLSGKSESSLVDPRYRGGFVFKNIYDHALRRCRDKKMAFIWGFTPAVKVWRDKLGFTVHNCIHYAIRIICLSSALSRFRRMPWTNRKKFVMCFLAIASFVYSLPWNFLQNFHPSLRKRTYSIEHNLRSSKDLQALYDRLRERYPGLIHIHQDDGYVTWRLTNNPYNRYEPCYVYQENELKGYSYTATSRKGDRGIINLTDFTVENEDVGFFLLNHLHREWHEQKAGVVYFLGNMTNTLTRRNFAVLGRFGFLKRRGQMAFVYTGLYDYLGNGLDVENCYINDLWTEGTELW